MASDPIIPPPAGEQFREFPLYLHYGRVALLPDEHDLVVNVQSGHFVLINWHVRYVVTDGQFTPSSGELSLMLTLLNDWPSFVPNRKLLQAMMEPSTEENTAIFNASDKQHKLDALHRLVNSCNEQLRACGLEIQSVNNHGYKLSRYTIQKGEQI
jgi:hypothetical protein